MEKDNKKIQGERKVDQITKRTLMELPPRV